MTNERTSEEVLAEVKLAAASSLRTLLEGTQYQQDASYTTHNAVVTDLVELLVNAAVLQVSIEMRNVQQHPEEERYSNSD